MSTIQQEAGSRLAGMAEVIAGTVTTKQYERQPELMARFGPSGVERTRQDTLYHLRYLAQSVSLDSPILFIQYISWLKILLARYGITGQDLLINLKLIYDALEEHLDSPSREVVLSHLDMGIYQLDQEERSDSFIDPDKPYALEAKRYLELLLDGRRREASRFVLKLHEEGVPVRDLYLYIFQVSQYEIGRLWQTGTISVAQEHYCTACTQSILSSLYPHWIVEAKKGPKLVAAGVGEELHEIGLRMLTDFFEMEGWDTHFLGANMPQETLLRYLRKHRPEVVAISVTLSYHVDLAVKLIGAIRKEEEIGQTVILVGGMPFNIDRELWMKVGADGYAPDAETAISVAERLLQAKIAESGREDTQ